MKLPFKGFFAGKSGPAFIAGSIAFIVVIGVFLVLRPAPKFDTYLILREGTNLTRGQALSNDMIGTVRLPADSNLATRAIQDTPDNRLNVKDRRMSRDLAGGNLLLHQDFSEPGTGIALRIDPALRAISIPVSAPSAVAHLIEPGSLVDVLAIVDGPTPADSARGTTSARADPVARTVLQGVRVLAVGGITSSSPYVNVADRRYSTVTLALTPEQVAQTVGTLAVARGGLILALRNPNAECPCDPVAEVGPAALRAANSKQR